MNRLITLLLSLFVTATLAASPIHWQTNYTAGLDEARKANKPILLYFTGTDWCTWCKKMDQEIFNTTEFADKAGNNFVFVELDFPMSPQAAQPNREMNAKLKSKYHVEGFPTVILIDANEKEIGRLGYTPGGGTAFATRINQIINK